MHAGRAGSPAAGRLALGLSYRGSAYQGWQSQPSGRTVQDALEQALTSFVAAPVHAVCAGRTDTGVHALNQVVHVDAPVAREPFSWVRGTNRFLPPDIAVQWALPVSEHFHARNSARGRRYRYLLRESAVRPALDAGLVGWSFRPLEGDALRAAAAHLIGTHDFSSFRSSECQSPTPVKTLNRIDVAFHGAPMAGYWTIDFDGNAFLHHMVRNLMACLVMVGSGRRSPGWMAEVLAARDRDAAAPTFSPDGLCFLGPYYDPSHAIPTATAAPWLLP
jgi:tRNA pseudouridine38-40 synthase